MRPKNLPDPDAIGNSDFSFTDGEMQHTKKNTVDMKVGTFFQLTPKTDVTSARIEKGLNMAISAYVVRQAQNQSVNCIN